LIITVVCELKIFDLNWISKIQIVHNDFFHHDRSIKNPLV